MTATVVSIADAIVVQLNAHPFSLPFTAVRGYVPTYELADMSTLHVTIVPMDYVGEPHDRSRDREEHRVHIAIQQRLTATGGSVLVSDLDPLMALVEEIRDYLRHERLIAFPIVRRIKTLNKPIYDPKHLAELGQFTSLLTLTYTVVR